MSTTSIQVVYPITAADIQARFAGYAALTADTPQGYKAVQAAIADLRGSRGEVEKRRKELKADSLEYGRRVDAVAKFLTQKIEEIENPLKAKKAAADEEKARAKMDAERAALEEERARLAAERAAFEQERGAMPAPASAPAAAQEETVTIPKSRYAELLASQEKLWALEAAGVEKWDGYEAAMRSRL